MNQVISNKTVIKPQKGWVKINFKELVEYKELIGFLAWRDILAQYKQAVFGVTWALFKPISQALIFTLIFGKIANFSSSGLPYPLFSLCGIIAWGFFSGTLSSSTGSIIANSNLITKIYFPRMIIPLSALGRSGLDLFISLVILVVLMLVYGVFPGWQILLFPLFVIMGFAIAMGVGLITSAIGVKYRDLAQVIPFLVSLWFWVTPVAYGIENIPTKFIWFFYLNPMTWIIEGFRWSLLGVGEMNLYKIIITSLFATVILLVGMSYFKRMEYTFADFI